MGRRDPIDDDYDDDACEYAVGGDEAEVDKVSDV